MAKKLNNDQEIFLLNDKYVLLSDLMKVEEGTKIELDLGCGTGDLALALAERKKDSLIFAADIQINRIRKVARKGKRAGSDRICNVSFLFGDRGDRWCMVVVSSCREMLG